MDWTAMSDEELIEKCAFGSRVERYMSWDELFERGFTEKHVNKQVQSIVDDYYNSFEEDQTQTYWNKMEKES